MESLVALSEGDEGVRSIGVVEYVEQFFDFVSDQTPWRTWSTLTSAEVDAIAEVQRLLDAACDATAPYGDAEYFITSGWPSRIQPAATTALELMSRRGRFSEDREEHEPGERA